MELLFVRHADAGSKSEWRGDDRLRPLSGRGREQAAALVDLLVPYGPVRIISSPLVRCIETVVPFSLRLGLSVEESEDLEPQAGEAAVGLVHDLADGRGPVVCCTHREIIEVLERRLVGGSGVEPQPKGSVWVVRASAEGFRSAGCFSRPDLAIQRRMGYNARSRVE